MTWAEINPPSLRKLVIVLMLPIVLMLTAAVATVAGPVIAVLYVLGMFYDAWHGRNPLFSQRI